MRFGHLEVCLDHDPGHRHPEHPDRLRAIRRELQNHHGVEYARPDPIDPGTVRAVHDEAYVEKLRTFCEDGGGQWDPDTVAVEATWDAAMASAGIATWVAKRALDGDRGLSTPFSLGRPPGHHAVADDAMGFCFVNNVVVAADTLASEGHRVAVVDWDVHHGNGTQDLLYDRGDVFFASVHERGLYPGTGDVTETGEGDGEGTTLNVPLPSGSGDGEYLAAFDELVDPLLSAFDPDVVLVSAGFDAHRHDPISRMRVSTEGYGVLAARLREIADDADAGLGFVLEGGYALDVLADSIGTVHETFAGYDPVDPDDEVGDRARAVLDEAREQFELD